MFVELPRPPVFTEEEISAVTETENAGHIFFEWLRYAAECAVTCSCVLHEPSTIRIRSEVQYFVFVGHLHRCAKLTTAYMELAQNRKYGEATMILDRCIFETAIRLVWILNDETDSRVRRYLADSVRTDIKLLSEINEKVQAAGGEVSVIEARMLDSIHRTIGSTGMSEAEIKNTKKLPDLASMLLDLGRPRLTYVANQAMGSHSVHGTWTHLRLNYSNPHDKSMALDPHDIDPHANNMATSAYWILNAVLSFLGKVTFGEPAESIRADIQQETERMYELFKTIGEKVYEPKK